MRDEDEKGRRGLSIARDLWPMLRPVEEGSIADRFGHDAFEGDIKVQVKTDATIARTGNLYIELYEKTKGRTYQAWRHSPCDAAIYIFVTEGKAIRLSTDTIVEAISNRKVVQISPTSVGVLVPLSEIPSDHMTIRLHDLWGQHVMV